MKNISERVSEVIKNASVTRRDLAVHTGGSETTL